MHRFKHIFVAVKPGVAPRAALTQAVSLAELTGGKLRLVSIVEAMPLFSELFFHSSTKDLEATLVKEAEDNLATLAASIAERGVSVETSVLRGDPVKIMIQEVIRQNADVLYKDIHEDEETQHGSFSPEDSRLLRRCPCPVWLVKPGEHETFDRILVAIDVEPGDPTGELLNKGLMEIATTLAVKEKAALHVVSAWRVYGEEMLSHRMEADEFETYRSAAQEKIQAAFDAVVEPFQASGASMEFHLLKGEPDIINTVLKEHNINLIIMGTVARSGVSGLVVGNTAERVLERVECSVLAIKPEGFVSPVSID